MDSDALKAVILATAASMTACQVVLPWNSQKLVMVYADAISVARLYYTTEEEDEVGPLSSLMAVAGIHVHDMCTSDAL